MMALFSSLSPLETEAARLAINEWWAGDPAQVYWMETTGRSDLGANLLAPQRDDAENPNNPGYVLVTHVNDGDIVLHWDTNTKALVAWSRATGGSWADRITWGSVPGGNPPTDRPAWVHGLDGPYRFPEPVRLSEIRAVGASIGRVHEALVTAYKGPLYFPFTKYAGSWDQARGGQPYMSKFPRELLPVFPRLVEYLAGAKVSSAPVKGVQVPGDSHLAYEPVEEDVHLAGIDAYSIDPAVVERGLIGRRRTQNELAEWVKSRGAEPLRPGPGAMALYDLAWRDGQMLYVCEVKSITSDNEEKQLRLGLGQVLRYAHLLQALEIVVVPVLVAENEPTDPSWANLCQTLGVRLVWPGEFDRILDLN